ncbi:epimerase [Tropicimonas sp. TH_r6]|uniref:epimerase n=1 Tax=Tropicimonas sp. TH_r6 TaxID=3082085 RepID=UPI002953486A|nr:epimerase [Tropicimonas sp. TH_r6]MDV7144609.1 epimerase [Tropicimonas sp. TH_r6]
MTGNVLILGATGRFGRHAATAFEAAGWKVTRYNRAEGSLWDACWGVDIIVNGWNPPYPRWQAELPGQTARLIEIAEASGARVILPGNVYPFGARSPARLAPETPHEATNPLGRARAEIEAVWAASNARVLILRGGDFLDTEASGNWFDKILTAKLASGRLTYPGPTDIPHSWAYLPDMARAAVALAEMSDALPRFADIPFPGYTFSGEELQAALERITGRAIKLARMSWLPVRFAAPFWSTGRHLLEMSYLWRKPHTLDSAAFRALLPEFRDTPLDVALASALHHQIDPDKTMARSGPRSVERGVA